MKKIIFIFAILVCQMAMAQGKGTIKGKLLDKEMDNEPLSFASVVIKGTTTGTETDMDGDFTLSVNAGSYTIVFSFLGYQSLEVPVIVKAGETVIVNKTLVAAEGVALEEVRIKSTVSKEKETALLLVQRKAVAIKESIGAQRLAKIGVSNAATATTKISGVTQSEGTGSIYIRGLGDRYLSTTMNGLPIPSDNVQNKNVDLSLFSTNLINSIGVSKTYTVSGYSDQVSGNVDISSKRYSKKFINLSINSGVNTAVTSNFKRSINSNDVTFGFHKKQYAIRDQIRLQGWDPVSANNTANFSVTLSGATKFELFGNDLSILASGSYGQSYEYREGTFRAYRANVEDEGYPSLRLPQIFQTTPPFFTNLTPLNDSPDVEDFYSNYNTTGYIRGDYKIGDNTKISYNTLFVNNAQDRVYEAGRNGLGYVFDQQPTEGRAFVRDQNFVQTTMFVNQLMGEHKLNEKNTLKWAGGYNFVLAEEPNRIRNEANILSEVAVTYADVGDFQQRKSSQKIEDTEYNGYVEDQYSFGEIDEDDNRPFRVNVGGNFRYKERTFRSQFVGVETPGGLDPSDSNSGFYTSNVDNFSQTFVLDNFFTGTPRLNLREQLADRYEADITVLAGYASLDFGLNKEFSGNVGVRYERNEINVLWDVNNFVGRVGTASKNYSGVYPSVNLKYELNEKSFIRFASSLTQTLPEFKEIAPFEYVSPTGRVTRGNPDLERSTTINADFKWEYFPESGELFSATVFYKNIQDPINLFQTRGSAGVFSYDNTGEKATVFGVEVEGRINLIKNEDDEALLNLNANVTAMSFNQDLFPESQFKGITESGLQGASDLIVNGSLSYNSRTKNEFAATLTGNYASDKIFALGSPEDFVNSDILFNDEIIEKGFVTLDLVLSKQLSEKFQIKFTGKNLLNPVIKQTQLITPLTGATPFNDTVLSYKRGSQVSVGLSYKF